MKTKLSYVIAGTMNWGVWSKNLNEKEMIHLMQFFVENKITSFDNADIYGGYTTEAQFGNALDKSGIKRETIQLITKCGIQHTQGRNNPIKYYDYSKEYIIWSVENSLKNLKTDYLDILLLHRPSPLLNPDEVAEAIVLLQKEGKIIDFGVSNFTVSQMELLKEKVDISCNQIQFSATHFEPMQNGVLDYMLKNGICPMAWNPLGNFFREDSTQSRSLKTTLAKLVEKYKVGADVLLLAWIMQHPAKIIPVAGTVNIARILQFQKLKAIKLETIDWFEIWTASLGRKVD